MYADTSRIFPVGKIFRRLVVHTTHRAAEKFPAHARGVVEPGRRIDAASAVSGTSASAERSNAVCTLHRVATFPHNIEPITIDPKSTIWCTAMPRARMKFG